LDYKKLKVFALNNTYLAAQYLYKVYIKPNEHDTSNKSENYITQPVFVKNI